MKLVLAIAVSVLIVGGIAPTAGAQDCNDPCNPCVKREWRERCVTVPAVTRTVRKPVYETIQMPVFRNEC